MTSVLIIKDVFKKNEWLKLICFSSNDEIYKARSHTSIPIARDGVIDTFLQLDNRGLIILWHCVLSNVTSLIVSLL